MVIQMNEEHMELMDTFARMAMNSQRHRWSNMSFFFFFFSNEGQVTPMLLGQCYGSGEIKKILCVWGGGGGGGGGIQASIQDTNVLYFYGSC